MCGWVYPIKAWHNEADQVKASGSFITTHLENQLVWVYPVGQAEGRMQIPLQLRDFLHEGQELSVNCFLVLLPLLCQLVLLHTGEQKTLRQLGAQSQ